MKQIFNYLFKEFKWYRKKVGGTWYKLYLNGTEAGHAAGITLWTQEPGREVDYEIVMTESYS